jgi:RHH-type proline utilization regulon transcriptional repressor/proline dehydrogenase/delta 1-pyrroline-5-carboxylate dehydrogenase
VGVQPGSEFHRTEYFGPVLGIMTAKNLAEAVEMQNAVDYGLTAGIHSLDPDEVSYWLDTVQAGNLYVNRGITGAIVRRQPFGGWKKSAVGPTAKAGGPNYLFGFGSFHEDPSTDSSVANESAVQDELRGLVDAAGDHLSPEDKDFVFRSFHADEQAWQEHFGVSSDVSQVGVERNVFRYKPFEATVRASSLTPLRDILRIVGAGLRAGARVHLSSTDGVPDAVKRRLTEGSMRLASYTEETELQFVERVRTNPPERIRLLGGNTSVMYVHFDGNPAVAIWGDEVTVAGRIEMLPFLHEQAVSVTGHRFGAPDPRFLELAV